jgi:hypothetical protein
MLNFLEIICLKCRKFKQKYKGGKNTKISGNPRSFYLQASSPLQNGYPIVSNN